MAAHTARLRETLLHRRESRRRAFVVCLGEDLRPPRRNHHSCRCPPWILVTVFYTQCHFRRLRSTSRHPSLGFCFEPPATEGWVFALLLDSLFTALRLSSLKQWSVKPANESDCTVTACGSHCETCFEIRFNHQRR